MSHKCCFSKGLVIVTCIFIESERRPLRHKTPPAHKFLLRDIKINILPVKYISFNSNYMWLYTWSFKATQGHIWPYGWIPTYNLLLVFNGNTSANWTRICGVYIRIYGLSSFRHFNATQLLKVCHLSDVSSRALHTESWPIHSWLNLTVHLNCHVTSCHYIRVIYVPSPLRNMWYVSQMRDPWIRRLKGTQC